MPANTNPIFTLTPNVGFGGYISTAAADYNGTSANYTLAFTAGANGSYVQSVLLVAVGNNASATTARIFLNNGSTHTTAANNQYIGESALPIATLTAGIPGPTAEFPCNFAIPAGYTIYVGLSVTVGAGFSVSVFGGDY